jgi:hypothetical protein
MLKEFNYLGVNEAEISFYRSVWNSVILLLENFSRIINLSQGYGIDFSNFNEEQINQNLFSWQHISRIILIISKKKRKK